MTKETNQELRTQEFNQIVSDFKKNFYAIEALLGDNFKVKPKEVIYPEITDIKRANVRLAEILEIFDNY